MKHSLAGLPFDRFGRNAGFKLLARGRLNGIKLLLRPVILERYIEFPYVLSLIGSDCGECLDVGSPRVFSMYVASEKRCGNILMINPDRTDLSETQAVVNALGIRNIKCECRGVESLSEMTRQYDYIWCISVIEHIRSKDCDDTNAVQWMYNALRPGGRLIITTVVDRKYWEEYRAEDCYSTQRPSGDGLFFFQRWYDEDALQARLCRPIARVPQQIRWYGEKRPGVYDSMNARWHSGEWLASLESAHIIGEYFQEYDSFEKMPGKGLVCFCFEKSP